MTWPAHLTACKLVSRSVGGRCDERPVYQAKSLAAVAATAAWVVVGVMSWAAVATVAAATAWAVGEVTAWWAAAAATASAVGEVTA